MASLRKKINPREFKIYPKTSFNCGPTYEKAKLNELFVAINTMIRMDRKYLEEYKNTLTCEIPDVVRYMHCHLKENEVIHIGRILSGPLMRSFRMKYPERYTIIRQLYKKLRQSSMNYVWSASTNYAIKIGRLINEPHRDMYFILN